MNKYDFIFAAIGMAGVIVIILELFRPAQAGDLKLGLFIGSDHKASTFNCDDVNRRFNETNPGWYAIYKGAMIGQIGKTSYDGCEADYGSGEISKPGRAEMLGYQGELGSYGPIDFSVSGALVKGYPDRGGAMGEYRAWISVNAKWNLFAKAGPKLFYGYRTSAYAVEWAN